MYTLSNRLRLFSIILMVVGLIGLIAGFVNRPGSIEEVKEMMAAHDAHGGGHGDTHVNSEDHSKTAHGAETPIPDAAIAGPCGRRRGRWHRIQP